MCLVNGSVLVTLTVEVGGYFCSCVCARVCECVCVCVFI